MALKIQRIGWLPLCGLFSLLSAASQNGVAQDTATFFQQNCGACHTIGGGRLVGPDLQNVLQRIDRKWLLDLIDNPQAALDSGGAYAKKLLDDSNGMVMPPISGMDRSKAGVLLDWIEAQSKSPGQTQPGGGPPAAAEPVFTTVEAALGREIAMGSRALANGGSPCISCHAFRGIPMLGGGSLGPDLTHEYTRLGGARAVNAWLSAPATPTMQAVYKTRGLQPEEIRALAAYLQSISESKEGRTVGERPIFVLLGLGGCLIALVLMDAFWKKRFNAVRRPLVAGKRGQ
jgi:mono/diheme cytochrome c family protein